MSALVHVRKTSPAWLKGLKLWGWKCRFCGDTGYVLYAEDPFRNAHDQATAHAEAHAAGARWFLT